MKISTTIRFSALTVPAILVVGCSDPTTPNPKILEQMNAQRKAQAGSQRTGQGGKMGPGMNPYGNAPINGPSKP